MFVDDQFAEEACEAVSHGATRLKLRNTPPCTVNSKGYKHTYVLENINVNGEHTVVLLSATNLVHMTKPSGIFSCCQSPDVIDSGALYALIGVQRDGMTTVFQFGPEFPSAAPPTGNNAAPLLAGSGAPTKTISLPVSDDFAQLVLQQHARLIPAGAHAFPGSLPPVVFGSVAEAADISAAALTTAMGINDARVRPTEELCQKMADAAAREDTFTFPSTEHPAHLQALLPAMCAIKPVKFDVMLFCSRDPKPVRAPTGMLSYATVECGIAYHNALALPEDANGLPMALTQCTQLRVLKLDNSAICVPAMDALSRMMPRSIVHLSLSAAKLSNEHLPALAAFVNTAMSLETLTLDDNNDLTTADPIADALCLPTVKRSFTDLSMARCFLVGVSPRVLCASRVLPAMSGVELSGPMQVSPEMFEELRRGHKLSRVTPRMIHGNVDMFNAILAGDSGQELKVVFDEGLDFNIIDAVGAYDHTTRRGPMAVDFSAVVKFADSGSMQRIINSMCPPKFTTLTSLNISCGFNKYDATITPFFDHVMQSPYLKVLIVTGDNRERTLPATCGRSLTHLATNATMTALDITGNDLGANAMVDLGMVLRKNRSLTSLHYDSNRTSFEGLKQVRGALYGNKKLADFPLPNTDIEGIIGPMKQEMQRAQREETQARMTMKRLFRSRQRMSARRAKDQMVGHLRERKRCARELAKIEALLKQIRADVHRNSLVFEAKQSAKDAARLARQREKEAARELRRAEAAAARERRKAEAAEERARLRAEDREAARQARAAARAAERDEKQAQEGMKRAQATTKRIKHVEREHMMKSTAGAWRRDQIVTALQSERDQKFSQAVTGVPVEQNPMYVPVGQVIPKLEQQYRQGHDAYLQRCAQAAAAPLPPGWLQLQDPQSGRAYFVCQPTGLTTWADPRVVNAQAPMPQFNTAVQYGAQPSTGGVQYATGYPPEATLAPEQRYAYQLMEAIHTNCFVSPLGWTPGQPQQQQQQQYQWSPQPQYAPVQPLGFSGGVPQQQQQQQQPMPHMQNEPLQQQQPQRPPQQQHAPPVAQVSALSANGNAENVLCPTAFLRYCGYDKQGSKRQNALKQKQRDRRNDGSSRFGNHRAQNYGWYNTSNSWNSPFAITGWYDDGFDYDDFYDNDDHHHHHHHHDHDGGCDDFDLWDDGVVDAIEEGLGDGFDDICDAFDAAEDCIEMDVDDIGDDFGDFGVDFDLDGYGGGADVSESDCGSSDDDDDGRCPSEVRSLINATALDNDKTCASVCSTQSSAARRAFNALDVSSSDYASSKAHLHYDPMSSLSGATVPSELISGTASTSGVSKKAMAEVDHDVAEFDRGAALVAATEEMLFGAEDLGPLPGFDAATVFCLRNQHLTSDELFVETVARFNDVAPQRRDSAVAFSYENTKTLTAPLKDLTLVTQCTVDRLPRLERLLKSLSHGARATAAVFEPTENAADLPAMLQALGDRVAASGALSSVELIIVKRVGDGSTSRAEDEQTDTFYPINCCRNVALDAAKTDAVMLVDVDFVVSPGTCRWLATAGHAAGVLKAVAKSNSCFVLPAFEVRAATKDTTASDHELTTKIPRTAAELQRRHATAFHVAHYPQGHRASDYDRWFASADDSVTSACAEPYSVNYEEGYEPYVITGKARAPRYDARFTGYGLNKVQHLLHMAALEFRFMVLPAPCFLTCETHARSKDWEKTFGAKAATVEDAMQRVTLQGVFQRFKREVNCASLEV